MASLEVFILLSDFMYFKCECPCFFWCPSEILLALSNVWGKRLLGQMHGIHLLMVCGISMLCSDRSLP